MSATTAVSPTLKRVAPPAANVRPTVYIVDDDDDVREALVWLMESTDLRPEPYPSAAEFLDAFDEEAPGCILLDYEMSGMNGLELQETLVENRVETPIVMLTGFGEVDRAVRAMRNGAVSFLEKPVTQNRLLEVIGEALAKDSKIRIKKAERREFEKRLAELSHRQIQILKLVAQGLKSRQISEQLQISVRTVESHRGEALARMEADTTELIQKFVYFGLIEMAEESET